MEQTDKKNVLLFVDDEANIIAALERIFRKSNYEIHIASGGQEALEILEQHPADLIMSDQRMPEMTGVEFFKQVKTLYPDTIRIILSGYSEASAVASAINEGEVYRFITKPWNDEELKLTIARSLEQHELIKQNSRLNQQVQKQNKRLKALNEDLERLVGERTRELEMSQRILFNLPLPVVGIDSGKTIVYLNKKAQDYMEDESPPVLGISTDKVFSREIGGLINDTFRDKITRYLNKHKWKNREIQVICKAVDPDDAMRGVTLLIEEK